MKIVNLFSLLAFAAITTFACKKNEAVVVVEDYTTLLTTGKWKQISETTAGVDTYTSKSACVKDNTVTFATTGSCTTDEGATKCSTFDPQTRTGSWAFVSADKKKVTWVQSIVPVTCTISELTTTSLKWQYTDPFSSQVVVEGYTK
jgi:hypothetical protein